MRLMLPAPRPTSIARAWVRNRIQAGDTVVDATTGNGHDTLVLASAVGPGGRVIGLDVQEAALAATRNRLESAGLDTRVTLHHESHARISSYAAPSSVSAVMFNLGYLPGADHALTTKAEETILALHAAATLLQPGGILSVVCYPGHNEGCRESEEVTRWFKHLDPARWRTTSYQITGTRGAAPFLVAAVSRNTPAHTP